MAANTVPIYPDTIRSEGTDITGSASAVTVWTAGDDGARIDKMLVKTATTGNLTLSKTDGTITMEFDAIPVIADTPVDIIGAINYPWQDQGGSLFLAAGWSIYAAADQDMTLVIDGGDY